MKHDRSRLIACIALAVALGSCAPTSPQIPKIAPRNILPTSAAVSPACTDAASMRLTIPGLVAEGRLDRALWALDRSDALCPPGTSESAKLRAQIQAELVNATITGDALMSAHAAASGRGDSPATLRRIRAQAAAAYERELGEARTVAFPEEGVLHASPDRTHVAIASPSRIAVVDLRTGQETLALQNHRFLTFLKSGLVVFDRKEKRAEMWDPTRGVRVWTGQTGIAITHVREQTPDLRWLRVTAGLDFVLDTQDGRVHPVPSLRDATRMSARGVIAGIDHTTSDLLLSEPHSATPATVARYDNGNRVEALSFSDNGDWLAIHRSKDIALFSIPERKIKHTLTCAKGDVTSVKFSPDSRTLWVSGFKEACVLDFGNGSSRRFGIPGKVTRDGRYMRTTLTPLGDGKTYLATYWLPDSFEGGEVFRVRDGRKIAAANFESVVRNAGDVALILGREELVRVVGEQAKRVTFNTQPPYNERLDNKSAQLTVSSDGRWVIAPAPDVLCLVDTTTSADFRVFDPVIEYASGAGVLGINNPEYESTKFRVRRAGTELFAQYPQPWLKAEQVSVAKGQIAIASSDALIRWPIPGTSVKAGRSLSRWKPILTGNGKALLQRTEARTTWLGTWEGKKLVEATEVDDVILSKDGNVAAVRIRKGFEIWNLDKKQRLGFVDTSAMNVATAVLSPEGDALAISTTRELRVWSTTDLEATPRVITTDSNPWERNPPATSFCGDRGHLLVPMRDGSAVFDTSTAMQVAHLAHHGVCTSDKTRLISIYGDFYGTTVTPYSLDPRSPHELWSRMIEGVANGIAHADGTHIAVMMKNGSIVLLNEIDGKTELTLRALPNGEASVALAPDGRVEIFGDEKQVQGRLSCRIGPRSFPFELCEERLLTPGLVKSVLGQ